MRLMSFAMNVQPILSSPSLDDGFRHQTTHDFEEQATFLKHWNQNYAQISAGAFEGFASEIHLDDLSLFWEFTSQSLHQEGCLAEDSIAIGVPLTSIENGMFCGLPCQKNTIHIYSGINGFKFISPQNLMIGLIVIDRHRLMEFLSADDQYFLNMQFKEAHIAHIPYHTFYELIQFLQSTFHTLKIQPRIADNAAFKQHVTSSAIQLIIDSLLVRSQPPQDALTHKSWEVIANTRELVALHQDNPITVAELCKSLAISRRALQYHFEQSLKTSPIAYLRAERLNGVRRMLKTANSVTEAATYWGFWHFGHFSQEYKKMFAELPSTTFKRFHSDSASSTSLPNQSPAHHFHP